MPYSERVFEAALKILDKMRKNAELELVEKKASLYDHIEGLKEIDDKISETSLLAIKKIAKGAGSDEILRLKETNLNLQLRRDELLKQNSVPADYLAIKHVCRFCKDTGYIKSGLCVCLKKLLVNEAAKELNIKVALERFTFENFAPNLFDNDLVGGKKDPITARERAFRNLEFCKNYVANFSRNAPSLLLHGDTGLGKTHLSLAIAYELLKKGYAVVYISCAQLISSLEDARFGRVEHATRVVDTFLECDLLILDDFGSEFKSQLATSELYNLINARLLNSKQTIVSTNLSESEMCDRYERRVASRLIGEYIILEFHGRDIRRKLQVNSTENGLNMT